MGHPAFVRSIVMGMKERRAIRCVARWTESGERKLLAPLVDEIVRRTTISVGYPGIVQRSLAFEKPEPFEVIGEGDPPGPTLASEPPLPLPAECKLLGNTYAQGGLDAVTPLLGPTPTRLIPLPSPGTCLAFFKSLPGPDGRGWDGLLDRIRKSPEVKLPAVERDVILRDFASYTKATLVTFGNPPRSLPLDDDGIGFILCFGAVTELRQRMMQAGDEPIDMIDDHVHLFRSDDDLFDDFDRELAKHPEYRSDPKMREAFGLIGPPPPN